jgi:ferredoxin
VAVQNIGADDRLGPLTLQIQINRDKCMGSGNCVFWAPQAFDLDDEGLSVLLEPDEADEADESQLFQAREGCPTGAISVWRDGVEVESR